MNILLDLIDSLSKWISKAFAWLSLPMIAVIVFEVFARKIFNDPTDWAHESTTMLYGTFCMIGAVWTLQEKGHVRTEVIHQMMSPKLQTLCDIITGLLALAMFAILFWGSFEFAADSWAKQEISSKSTWGVVIYPFKTVIPLATGLMFLQQLANIIRDVAKLCGKRQPLPELAPLTSQD